MTTEGGRGRRAQCVAIMGWTTCGNRGENRAKNSRDRSASGPMSRLMVLRESLDAEVLVSQAFATTVLMGRIEANCPASAQCQLDHALASHSGIVSSRRSAPRRTS